MFPISCCAVACFAVLLVHSSIHLMAARPDAAVGQKVMSIGRWLLGGMLLPPLLCCRQDVDSGKPAGHHALLFLRSRSGLLLATPIGRAFWPISRLPFHCSRLTGEAQIAFLQL